MFVFFKVIQDEQQIGVTRLRKLDFLKAGKKLSHPNMVSTMLSKLVERIFALLLSFGNNNSPEAFQHFPTGHF